MTDIAAFAELCPDCRRPILWPWTTASAGVNQMPVDAEPVKNGNVLVTADPLNAKRIVCAVMGRANARRLAAGGYALYQHHRLTCIKADKWARPQRHPIPAVSTAGDLGALEKEGLF